MPNAIYTIVAGVNGAGKSTLTGFLKSQRSDLGIIINPDKLSSDYNLDIITAGKKVLVLIDDCLSKRISFTQETTLSGKHIIKNIISAKSKGYYIRLYYIGLDSLDEHLKRISNRVEKGGHNIDSEYVIKRFNSRFGSLLPVLPHCDEVHIFDNGNGPSEIGEYKNGEIIVKSPNPPQWFNDLVVLFNDSINNLINKPDIPLNKKGKIRSFISDDSLS